MSELRFSPTHILVRFTNNTKDDDGNIVAGKAVHSEQIQLIDTAGRTGRFRNQKGGEANLPIQKVFAVASASAFDSTNESQIVVPMPGAKTSPEATA